MSLISTKESTKVSSSGSVKHLRIGIVFDDTLDRPDGVQQFILLLADWLKRQGHQVYFLVGETKRQDLEHVYSLSRTAKVSFNGNTLAIPLPAAKSKIVSLLKDLKLDVLHVQVPYSPFMAGKVIAASSGEALVGTFHILPYGKAAIAGTRLLGSIQRKNLARFEEVTATSQPASEFASSAYGRLATVVPNPVDVTRFRGESKAHKTDSKTTRIVFLGRLVPRKGAMQLLQAVNELKKRGHQNLEVRIGGGGAQHDELNKYVQALGLSDIVTFDGFIDESSKASYLSGADIAVFPAMAGESFGIVLIEAMAAGAGAVVGGDNPGYRSVLGEWSDCLVDAHNTPSFADALEKLIADNTLRQRLHAEQQKAVDRYDIDVVGAQFAEIYSHAILHHAAKVQ